LALADFIDIEFQRKIIRHASCAIAVAIAFALVAWVIKLFVADGFWRAAIEGVENFCLLVIFVALAIDLLLGIVHGVWRNVKGFLNDISTSLVA
jgi:hypothetical protein